MLKTWSRLSRSRLFAPKKNSKNYSSGHVPLSANGMKLVLNKAKIPFRSGFTCIRVRCPRCSRESDKVQGYLNYTSGTFVCQECELVADWEEVRRSLESGYDIGASSDLHAAAFPSEDELDEVQRRLSSAVEVANVKPAQVDELLRRLDLGRIKSGTLVRGKYHISYDDNDPKIVLPVRGYRKRLIGLKYVGRDGVETFPREDMAGFFSTESVLADNQAVLVSHPADAILVTQETKLTSIAVDSTAQLPITRLPLLEHFGKIVLWFHCSNDQWQNAIMYARKLGTERSFYVRQVAEFTRPLTTKTIAQALKSQLPMSHKSVMAFEELRDAVRNELMKWDTAAGVKWTRFPALNKYLKGHRRGELTIFTGQTGSGKTTFLCELSLDLMMQGVPTLWGSFEINNVKLLKTLMTQFALLPLTEHMNQFDETAEKFQKLPLFMLKYHGQEKIHTVLEAMTHAVYVHDIQHVVLDNLQFMMGVSEDRFQRQDMIISTLRKFATENNVHVTLVVHPRKEKDDDPLGTASIFGSGKASQEADNVLILQRSARGAKFIQVTKNRFDGDLGAFPLVFDKPTQSYWKRQSKSLNDPCTSDGTIQGGRRRTGGS